MPERIDTIPDTDAEFREVVRKQFPDQAYRLQDGSIGFKESNKADYLLGSPDYPVASYRELIVDTVKNNLITIITAKTGTGKSTNVPQFLFEDGGFDRVIITQPRILAARELKAHVADDIAESLHDREHRIVGYQTAVEGDSSDENAIVYVTDGLQLMREIIHKGVQSNEVLVLDEFHERSSNMDALFALAVEYGIRVVIMSATLDAEAISKRYSKTTKHNVPIIEVLGVAHEVAESDADDLENEIVTAAKEVKNILVFLPGRNEITTVMSRIRRRVSSAYTLLELHGDQPPDKQRRVMGHYDGGKIIFSTSVGQTSITIPDIDVVIDCGFERTMILTDKGVEDLATQPASKASGEQRRGRVGRTKEGEYIRAPLRGFPVLPSDEDRAAYDTPEIQRMHVDELELKLMAFGRSILTLPFYDFPTKSEVDRASERLSHIDLFRKIGETAIEGYEVTEKGLLASKLPLDAHSARMVIESRKYGKEVELQMMAAAAVRQINGITHTAKGMENWRGMTKEMTSDIIAGIDFMVGALQRTEAEQEKRHIVRLRYEKALRAFEQLAKRRNLDMYDLKSPNDEQREQLLKSIIVGADEIFVLSGKSYVDSRLTRRQPVRSTVIREGAELLIGKPFDLEQVRRGMVKSHTLINSASVVTIEQLQKEIPNRLTTVIEKLFVSEQGIPRTVEAVYFDGKPTRHKIEGNASPSPELQRFIIEHILSNKSLGGKQSENIKEARRVIAELHKLQHKTTENLGIDYSLKHDVLERMLKETNYMGVTFNDFDPFIDLSIIEAIVPQEIRDEINNDAPDEITIHFQKRNVKLKVMYHNNNAYITTQPRYYSSIPFTIGSNHKVYVKPTQTHVDYISVGKARDRYSEEWAQPTRGQRRGIDTNDNQQPHRKDQHRGNIKLRLR